LRPPRSPPRRLSRPCRAGRAGGFRDPLPCGLSGGRDPFRAGGQASSLHRYGIARGPRVGGCPHGTPLTLPQPPQRWQSRPGTNGWSPPDRSFRTLLRKAIGPRTRTAPTRTRTNTAVITCPMMTRILPHLDGQSVAADRYSQPPRSRNDALPPGRTWSHEQISLRPCLADYHGSPHAHQSHSLNQPPDGPSDQASRLPKPATRRGGERKPVRGMANGCVKHAPVRDNRFDD
jgi:hypothetical protein